MWALALMGLIGSVFSAFGQYSQGQENKRAQDYNASVLEGEAGITRAGAARESEIIRQNAILNEYRQRKSMDIVTGAQVGAYSRAGVSVATGSPLDVIADSIANAELEISIDKWNAENQIGVTKYNAEIGALNKESEARFRRLYGKSAATNANYQAVGTLLSSGTQYGSALSKEKPKTKIGE